VAVATAIAELGLDDHSGGSFRHHRTATACFFTHDATGSAALPG
jgi:hypothetical protein